MSKDRMDALGVVWHDTTAQKGEACIVCKAKLRKGIRILAERVLPGANVRPNTMHRACWLLHTTRTEREYKARQKQMEQERVDTAAVEV